MKLERFGGQILELPDKEFLRILRNQTLLVVSAAAGLVREVLEEQEQVALVVLAVREFMVMVLAGQATTVAVVLVPGQQTPATAAAAIIEAAVRQPVVPEFVSLPGGSRFFDRGSQQRSQYSNGLR